MTFYAGFVVPFVVGTGVLFAVILYKYVRWFVRLPRRDKLLVRKNFFSVQTLKGVWECISECLLHRKIWRANLLLGYMHTAFALGWALLIAVGWVETVAYLGGRFVPLQGHIFFKYFTTSLDHGPRWGVDFEAVMDLLLLYVLSGLVLAVFKRFRSRALGMKRTTKLTLGDRIALTSLWFVFPMRLVAESFTSGIHGSGGFLTGSLGEALTGVFPAGAMPELELAAWWGYSIALGVFFVAMPFSRYMHIFTEVPLIFLRRWGLRSGEHERSFDHFQLEACSRCGLCIDPCQLQRDAGFRNVQSAYFIRDRRYNRLTRYVADNCLLCGRCQRSCPVGLELDTLRLNSRHTLSGTPPDGRFDYAKSYELRVTSCKATRQSAAAPTRRAEKDQPLLGDRLPVISNGVEKNVSHSQISTPPKIGFFAGCMTLLSPKILTSMERIFAAAGDDVWWVDRDGGVCCGRPLKLSGDVDAAREMMAINTELFRNQGITLLITSCPICLRVFREDYRLEGVEVLHHSEYFARLLAAGRLDVAGAVRESMVSGAGADTAISAGLSAGAGAGSGSGMHGRVTYHDPCDLGRGCGVYDAPRDVIRAVLGDEALVEPAETGPEALCCGGSLANTAIGDGAQTAMSRAVGRAFEATGAGEVVTGCPLCKKTLARGTTLPVVDLSELLAAAIRK